MLLDSTCSYGDPQQDLQSAGGWTLYLLVILVTMPTCSMGAKSVCTAHIRVSQMVGGGGGGLLL